MRPWLAAAQLAVHGGAADAQRAGGLGGEVLEFRTLRDLNTDQVEHANAAAVGAKQGRACAAEGGIVIIKMFTAVQPDRMLLAQRRHERSIQPST